MNIAVVTVARAGYEIASRLLSDLQDQGPDREVLVVNCCGPGVTQALVESFPAVKIVEVSDRLTGAQARYAGVRNSTAEVVAVVHERYRIPPGWFAAIETAHQQDIDAVGGGIAPGPGFGNMEWAMYLTEYSQVAPPLPAGPLDLMASKLLPGGNVSYKRLVFEVAPMDQALSELDFHEALHRAGARFSRCSGMDVQFASPLTLAEYLEERRRFSRAYGARLFQNASVLARYLAAASRLALPPLLLTRYARQSLAKTDLRAHFWGALPWMTYFAWIQTREEIAGIINGTDVPPHP